MANKKKVAAATGAVSAVKSNPYLQRAINDDQVHGNVRDAIDAAKAVAGEFQSRKTTGKVLQDDTLYDELQKLAVAVLGTGELMKAAPKKQKGGGFFKKLVLLVFAGGAALAASESLRSKVLDLLFGAEEEFQYTPQASSSNGTAAPGPAAPSETPVTPAPAADATETTETEVNKAEASDDKN